MPSFRRIPVNIDAATGLQIDPDTGSPVKTSEYIRLIYGTITIVCARFYDVAWTDGVAALTAHAFNETDKMQCVGDKDFDTETSLMFSAVETDDEENVVNLAGDWFGDATADKTQGQISFRINTNVPRFTEALGSLYEKNDCYFAIEKLLAGETVPSGEASFKFKAVNRPSSVVGTPVSGDPEYLNAIQIYALLSVKLDVDFSGYSEKSTLNDNDKLIQNDSEDSGAVKWFSLSTLWTWINNKANTVYAVLVHSHAISDVTGLQASLDAKESTANKGAANGYAELGADGKVPSGQLPSYVDDVLEYADYASLPVTGETGKVYVTLDDNKIYRWSGSAYVEIPPSLALGETSSTAYRGDRGKIAYDHSQLTSGNPHNVSKSDVGLGNVNNILDKLDATTAPTADDDSGDGYTVGSRWHDVTNGKAYVCLDSTSTAAVWIETTAGAAGGEANTASNTGSSGIGIFKQKTGVALELYKLLGIDGITVELDGSDKINIKLSAKPKFDATSAPTVDNDVDEGYSAGSLWVDVTNGKAYVCLDSTDGAAVWFDITQSGGGSGGGGEYGTAGDLTLSSGSITPTATTHKFSVIPENYAGSTMTASPSATDTTITVTSGTNFSQGQRVKIQDNTYSEYGWIKSVSSNTLTLYSGLTNGYDHTDGGEVLIMSDTLTTLASTNVNEGTVILIKPKYDGSIIEVDNGGGNIIVPDGCNTYLPTTGETMFVYDGSNWKMLNNYGVLFEDIVIFFDNSMSAATINGLSASVPRSIGPNILTFQFLDGTYSLSEALSFNGFTGSGTLSILGNPDDYSLSTPKSVELQFNAGLNGINILNNTNSIIAIYALKISIQQQSGVTINGINSNGNSAYTYCRFNYVLCDGKTYTSYGIYVNYNPGTFWLQGNYVSNLSKGIYASNCSHVIVTSNDDTGTAPDYGLSVNAATIYGNTTQPDGTISPTQTNAGGVISLS